TTLDDVSFAVDGTVIWMSGLLAGGGVNGVTIRPSGSLSITGALTKTIEGRVRSAGMISCFSTNVYGGNGRPCIYNTNVFVLYSNLSWTATITLAPTLWNFGTLLLPAGGGVRT